MLKFFHQTIQKFGVGVDWLDYLFILFNIFLVYKQNLKACSGLRRQKYTLIHLPENRWKEDTDLFSKNKWPIMKEVKYRTCQRLYHSGGCAEWQDFLVWLLLSPWGSHMFFLSTRISSSTSVYKSTLFFFHSGWSRSRLVSFVELFECLR